MDTASSDAALLSGGRGAWSATPWNYSGLRWLRFARDGTGDMTYGYGQTIYAIIKCLWEIPAAGRLRLTYLESPGYQRFQGFSSAEDSRVRELRYSLTEGDVTGTESIIAQPYKFLWTLELSEAPWPSILQLPYEVPRVFYGYRQQVGKVGAD